VYLNQMLSLTKQLPEEVEKEGAVEVGNAAIFIGGVEVEGMGWLKKCF